MSRSSKKRGSGGRGKGKPSKKKSSALKRKSNKAEKNKVNPAEKSKTNPSGKSSKKKMLQKKRGQQERKQRTGRPVLNFALFFCIGFSFAGMVSFSLHAKVLVQDFNKEANTLTSSAVKQAPQVADKIHPVTTRKHRSPMPPRSDLIAAEGFFQEGYEYMKKERFGAAFEKFKKAAELAPIDSRPLIGMAKIYKILDYSERAEVTYRKAIEIEPDTLFAQDARIFLSRLLCDFGRNKESIALLKKAERNYPDDSRVWAELAVNEFRLGNFKEASMQLERYNKAVGPQSWGFANLGEAYAEMGKLKEAEELLRKSIQLDSHSELGNLWLGKLLVATGRIEKAESFLKKFRRLRKYQTRKHELEQAVARRPGDTKTRVKLLVALAHMRELLGRSKKALIPLKKAVELMPHDQALQKLYQGQLQRAGKGRGP